MTWIRRMFDSRHRRARAAEGAGQWRRAAALWAEAGEPARAAEALLHLASRGGSLEERLEAWHDALRWIPEDDEGQREEVERRMAMAVLEDAQHRGAASGEEKRRLAEAAARLERLDRAGEAAEAYAILGRTEDQARCLEAAGDIEKLEALLSRTSDQDAREGKLRRLMADYESSLTYGARIEARAALREAAQLAPNERSIGELHRRFESRLPSSSRVRVDVGGRRVSFVGRLPAVLGRAECDVPVRGTSVSRRHAEIALGERGLVIRDLDSRNGTLVRGLPIKGSIELGGDTEIGLGDDVSLSVKPLGRSVVVEVLSGLDRGERVVIGDGELRIDGLPAAIKFAEGWAILAADADVEMALEGKPCALPVHLLKEDRLVVGGVVVEVIE
jgi:pSer/pThr/pTyr-binding forkhead associated (FHA) protein